MRKGQHIGSGDQLKNDNIIACRTCIWQYGSKCNKNTDGDCLSLNNDDLGISVMYYQDKIPKNHNRYAYAYWEPRWQGKLLPDELFEI